MFFLCCVYFFKNVFCVVLVSLFFVFVLAGAEFRLFF